MRATLIGRNRMENYGWRKTKNFTSSKKNMGTNNGIEVSPNEKNFILTTSV